MGVPWMVKRGAGFVLADAGAAPPSEAAWKAIRIERPPSAADRIVKRNSEILLMSFSYPMFLHYGSNVTFACVTPGLTLRAATCPKLTPPAAFVKKGV